MKNSLQPLSSLKSEFLFFAPRHWTLFPPFLRPGWILKTTNWCRQYTWPWWLDLWKGWWCVFVWKALRVGWGSSVSFGWSLHSWMVCFGVAIVVCWFAWWCLVYIVLIGLVLGGTLRCHKGDSLYEPDHRRSPMKNLIAAEVKIKPCPVPMWNHPESEKIQNVEVSNCAIFQQHWKCFKSFDWMNWNDGSRKWEIEVFTMVDMKCPCWISWVYLNLQS